jgi:3-hydroxybutyryl-CoA dehydrogenase
MFDEKKICIAGAGRMGVGIATALLLRNAGYRVTLLDFKQREGAGYEALDRAKAEIASNLDLLKDLGEIEGPSQELLEYLTLEKGPHESLSECDFLFEAVPERPELKQDLIARVEPLLSEDAVIASATSTIDLGTLCKASARPEMIVIAHWLNPAFIIPLVEIAVGKKTSPVAVEKIKGLLTEIEKIPVIVKDSPGFIVPRIQVAVMNEAVRIVEEGLATPEDVDTAIKAGFGFRLAVLGLIEFIDLGGLDILYHASNNLYDKLGRSQFKPVRSVVEKMDAGQIGPKTGIGFFDYRNTDISSLFRDRYRGFIELLNLVKRSKVLNFSGDMRQHPKSDPGKS